MRQGAIDEVAHLHVYGQKFSNIQYPVRWYSLESEEIEVWSLNRNVQNSRQRWFFFFFLAVFWLIAWGPAKDKKSFSKKSPRSLIRRELLECPSQSLSRSGHHHPNSVQTQNLLALEKLNYLLQRYLRQTFMRCNFSGTIVLWMRVLLVYSLI